MPVESAQDRLDMLDLDEWAADITIPGPATIQGIVDAEFQGAEIGEYGITASAPQFTCRTADIPSLAETNTITIANDPGGNDGTYTVKEIQSDGTGISLVTLIKGT